METKKGDDAFSRINKDSSDIYSANRRKGNEYEDITRNSGEAIDKDPDSRRISRKNSSSSSDFNEFKNDKFSRESSSRSESLQRKKRYRSEDRNYPIDKRRAEGSKSKSKSRSPKYSGIKNKVTSMINEKKSSQIFIPGFDGPLVSLSLFNELQHNILQTESLENAYKDYKNKYEQKRFHSFYVEHQNDEWFKEKYDPELSAKWRGERNAQCQKLANKFFETVTSGGFRNLKLELREQDENNKNVKILIYGYSKEKSEFEEKERDLSLLTNTFKSQGESVIDISAAPYYGFDPDKMTLFLHQIPRNVSRFQILEIVKKLPGFISMSLSEPIKNQNYYRYCWVTFDSEENTELAYETLNDYRISSDYKILPIKSKSMTVKRIRITPPYFDERLNEDLELTKSFIQIYDKDKAIENNPILNNNKLSQENLFDLGILYLRRVHGFCFYCLEEHEDERALATKCDNIHLRHYKILGPRKNEIMDANKYESEWDKNFTRLAKFKLEKGIDRNRSIVQINEERNKRRTEFCKENTSAVNAERYVCNICNKMFKGPNFVYNHIFNKHMSMIEENVDKDFLENLKYENYVNDPNKICEKYKIISSMDEYLHYLNTIKSFQHGGNVPYNYDSKRGYSGGKYSKDRIDRDRGESSRKRRHAREYRDLDNPNESSTTGTSGRQLISYDDL